MVSSTAMMSQGGGLSQPGIPEWKKIQAQLRRQGILVSGDWLDQCVQFLIQETNIQPDRLLLGVQEQWLSSDISVEGIMERGVLPANLAAATVAAKVSIPAGRYPVQVNRGYDIGCPAYAQLQKMRKANTENVRVSADDSTSSQADYHPTQGRYVAAWEPKPSRMLQLEITDGFQILKAVERQPIAALPDIIPPGLKLELLGPLECRRGVVLLTASSVRILGGVVEEMAEGHATDRVLAERLARSNPAVLDRLLAAPPSTALPHVPASDPSQSSQRSLTLLPAASRQVTGTADVMAPPPPLSRGIVNSAGLSAEAHSTGRGAAPLHDGSLHRVAGRGIIGGVHVQNSFSSRQEMFQSGQPMLRTTDTAAVGHLGSHTTVSSSGSLDISDNPWDDDEDFVNGVLSADEEEDMLLLSALDQNQIAGESTTNAESGINPASRQSTTSKDLNASRDTWRDRENVAPGPLTGMGGKRQLAITPEANKIPRLGAVDAQDSGSRVYNGFRGPDESGERAKAARVCRPLALVPTVRVPSGLHTGVSGGPAVSTGTDLELGSDDELLSSLEMPQEEAEEQKGPAVLQSSPFVYLSALQQEMTRNPTRKYLATIKASSVSLVGKVKVKVKSGTAFWSVSILLTDGSSNIQADISPRILEEELGSAARYAAGHQTDPAVKEDYRLRSSQLSHKLATLNCLVKLRFPGQGAAPVIEGWEPVTEILTEQLLRRQRAVQL